jgi:hypothetical protein
MKAHFIFMGVLLSLVVILVFAEVAVANPVGMYGPKPKYAEISIGRSSDDSQISFTVKTNYYWATGSNHTDSHCFALLGATTYEVDNLALVNNVTVSDDYAYIPYSLYTLKGTVDVSNFVNLTSGTHNLEINYGYYHTAFANRRYTVDYVSLDSATAQITVTTDIATPTPPPSGTPTTAATPAIIESQTTPNFPLDRGVLVAIIVTVVLVISSLLLVLSKKRKPKTRELKAGSP